MFNPKKRKIDLEVKLNTEYDWDYGEKSFAKQVIDGNEGEKHNLPMGLSGATLESTVTYQARVWHN